MTPRFHRNTAHQAHISWMLVVAFVVMLLSPYHYHMQHTGDSPVGSGDVRGHVTDVHGYADPHDLDHHGDSHVIEPATDLSVKSTSLKLPWVFLLIALVLLLPLPTRLPCRWPLFLQYRIPRHTRHSIPPLRAPPHV